MPLFPDRSRQLLRYVIALAFMVRLAIPVVAWAILPSGPQVREPDSDGYLALADELVRTGAFTSNGEPELARTPGYPMLLATGVLFDRVELITIALQVALGCATTYFTYRLGRLLLPENVAILAAALFACEPLSSLYCSLLLTETLFTCVVAGAMTLLLEQMQSSSWRLLCVSAAAFAVAAYIRPIAYFLPWAVALAIMLLADAPLRLRVKRAVGLIAVPLAVLAPWQLRNGLEAGYWRFSAIGDINLYYYQAAAVLAEQRKQPLGVIQQELGFNRPAVYFREHPEQRGWTEADRYAYMRAEARQIIAGDFPLMVRLHLAGIRGALADVGSNAFQSFLGGNAEQQAARKTDDRANHKHARPNGGQERAASSPLHFLLRLASLGLLGFSVIGLASSAMRMNRKAWMLLAIVFYFLFLSGGPVGYHRFRLPCIPVFAVLAAQGLYVAGAFGARQFSLLKAEGARRN